jgi:hypothetical protein
MPAARWPLAAIATAAITGKATARRLPRDGVMGLLKLVTNHILSDEDRPS